MHPNTLPAWRDPRSVTRQPWTPAARPSLTCWFAQPRTSAPRLRLQAEASSCLLPPRPPVCAPGHPCSPLNCSYTAWPVAWPCTPPWAPAFLDPGPELRVPHGSPGSLCLQDPLAVSSRPGPCLCLTLCLLARNSFSAWWHRQSSLPRGLSQAFIVLLQLPHHPGCPGTKSSHSQDIWDLPQAADSLRTWGTLQGSH